MQTVALIDYGSGNLHSANRALIRAAADYDIDAHIKITSDPDFIANADRVVLPGVGHFADCMSGLQSRNGLIEGLTEAVKSRGCPFFGICVGMQLLADRGLEDGETLGLGWISGEVDEIPRISELRIPHMGWNDIQISDSDGANPLFSGIAPNTHVYFVHSFFIKCSDDSRVAATTDYGQKITAAVLKDNIFGTQFHPEKSQEAGQKLLANWLRWAP